MLKDHVLSKSTNEFEKQPKARTKQTLLTLKDLHAKRSPVNLQLGLVNSARIRKHYQNHLLNSGFRKRYLCTEFVADQLFPIVQQLHLGTIQEAWMKQNC
jgi:hypothetical protein